MKKFAALLLLLGLLTGLQATSQTIKNKAPEPLVCLPQSQAATITDALRRYDVLRAEQQVQGRLVGQLTQTDSVRRLQVATLRSAADSSARAVLLYRRRLDVTHQRLQLSQGRARRRGWVVVGLGAVLSSFVYFSVAPR